MLFRFRFTVCFQPITTINKKKDSRTTSPRYVVRVLSSPLISEQLDWLELKSPFCLLML